MGNTKPMIGGRVDPETREWIEREAEQRDRSISYIVDELLTESIERRERQDGDGKPVPA